MLSKIIWIFLFLFALTAMLVGQTLYEFDLEQGELRDIYNYTLHLNISEYDSNSPVTSRIGKSVEGFMIWAKDTSFDVIKSGIEWGYTHPEIDYKVCIQLIIGWIIALCIMSMVPLIIPFIALIYLIGVGIKKLFSKKKKEVKQDE